MFHKLIKSLPLLAFWACTGEKPQQAAALPSSPAPVESKAQEIISAAIEKHGGKRFANSIVKFTFRDRNYKATRKAGSFEYERAFVDSTGAQIQDILTNVGFVRKINGQVVNLDSLQRSNYANSVNSVLYFALLPYFLNDAAVIKEYLGEVTIKKQPYHKIKVTFRQEGGGKDHEDEYIYWIHRDEYTMDYLAYNYQTDGGGARFREAYNVQLINGIRFADYVNYKPKTATMAIETFDHLFETGGLEALSKIENQNIEVILLDEGL